MELQTENNQVQIIERSTIVFQSAGQILVNNQTRSQKAIAAGRKILDAIKTSGMTQELDQAANDYLSKVSKAAKEMKEGRAEVTQIMDEIKKMYTAIENDLDTKKVGTVPALIQEERNAYAKKCAEEEKRKREEAERIAAKQREAAEIKSAASIALNNYFQTYLLGVKQKMQGSFNSCTLENIEAFNEQLKTYKPFYKTEHFSSFTYSCGSVYHTPAEITTIVNSVKTEDNYKGLNASYQAELTSLAQDLSDKLPSKSNELTEAKRIAEEQAAAAEQARIAEEKRQTEIAQASAANKARLEEEARIAREQEAERVRKAQEEQARLAEEKRVREEAEAARLRQEAEDAKKEAELKAEMDKQSEQTMIMFEKEASVSETATAPEARQGYEINVTHQAGYAQIFQFWFEKEGRNLGLDKMEKTSLGQMKAFCEKYAHKNNEKIDSKFIQYEASFKAVNRKVSPTK